MYPLGLQQFHFICESNQQRTTTAQSGEGKKRPDQWHNNGLQLESIISQVQPPVAPLVGEWNEWRGKMVDTFSVNSAPFPIKMLWMGGRRKKSVVAKSLTELNAFHSTTQQRDAWTKRKHGNRGRDEQPPFENVNKISLFQKVMTVNISSTESQVWIYLFPCCGHSDRKRKRAE